MLRLHNTLTRKKELLRPVVEGKIGIYTCGPTLHDFAHLGLIRRLLTVDLLRRVLASAGYEVRHVVNLTDIDDKTIAESGRRSVGLEALTSEYAKAFFEDVRGLRMLEAEVYPRATQHVDAMIDLTRRLVEAGVAYERQRSVYFDISKFPSYGKLSRADLSQIKTGATVDLDYYEKDEPRDFTLMRRSDLKELRRRISYQTDWGHVRPGWHIECAAMATKYLGQSFDIHTSGQDLTFPHNENENAICEALSGKPMARMWLHSGMILRDGKKMSRSLGTALTFRDLVARGYSPTQIRYYLLGTHYRKNLDFSFAALDAACKELAKLDDLIHHLRGVSREGPGHRDVDTLVEQAERAFVSATRDDLNLPRAKAAVFTLLRGLNARTAGPGLTRADAELALDFVYRADRILAVLDFGAPSQRDEKVEELLREREKARAASDYVRADALRRELVALGYRIEDTPAGQRVRRHAEKQKIS